MSLLSDQVVQVLQSPNVVGDATTRLTVPISEHFTLMSGVYKQIVGYLAPRNAEYTYVLDINTGEPLQLPQGYLWISFNTKAVELFDSSVSLDFYFTDSTDLGTFNTISIDGYNASELNTFTYDEQDQEGFGNDNTGYNWIVAYNNNYPDIITGGVLKVIVEYI